MDVTEIQQALQKAGFDPGSVDGAWGRRTIAAVKAFQQARGLTADGIVGPQTANALMGNNQSAGASVSSPGATGAAEPTGPMVWYEEARRLLGTKETPGPESNQTIIAWAKDCNIDYASDDIPWCGLFTAHCIASTLPEEPLPNGPLLARNWLKFGKKSEPVQGAVLVFWRGSKSGTSGHVGFYRSEDDAAYHVLGGNQSDSVSTSRVAKDRLLGARWPSTAMSIKGARVQRAASGALSHNEA
jgi:uncharacterized protein (TIGR02594 family)